MLYTFDSGAIIEEHCTIDRVVELLEESGMLEFTNWLDEHYAASQVINKTYEELYSIFIIDVMDWIKNGDYDFYVQSEEEDEE